MCELCEKLFVLEKGKTKSERTYGGDLIGPSGGAALGGGGGNRGGGGEVLYGLGPAGIFAAAAAAHLLRELG